MARSYANLLDLAAGDAPLFTRPMLPPQPRGGGGKAMTRSATASGVLSEGPSRDDELSIASDTPSSLGQERLIMVANMLPLLAERDADTQTWKFRWDEDALLLQMRDGISNPEREDMEIIYVGSLKVEVDPSEQDRVAAHLLDKFNCVPTFLPPDLSSKFYHGFCKQQLWPLFHYMLPLSPQHGGLFDRELWQAYVAANKIFSDKVMEVISPEDDFVWVHDYHLMVLPTFLRKKFNRVRLGFFLHSPFPSSEIYRTLPVREEILRALLNADLIGFHTFDYARHFLSCCSRMLGLEYESKRGYIGLDYYGRTVGIKISPVGVDMGRLTTTLQLSDTEWRLGELKAEYQGKTVILGVDDMDIFKGLSLKLQAFEQFLRQHPEWVGRAVLVQITNPARGRGRDVLETQDDVHAIVRRLNAEFGREGYEPVVLLQRHVPLYERVAFYILAECLVVTAVRDGMNLTPYEYTVCRQGILPPLPHRLGHATSGGGGKASAPSRHSLHSKPDEVHRPVAGVPKASPSSSSDPSAGAGAGASGRASQPATGPSGLASTDPSPSPSAPPAASSSSPPAAPASAPSSGAPSLLVGTLPNLPPVNTGRGRDAGFKKRSAIVVSEFIGCSPSLSGAIRINPWNVQAVADAMNSALTMPLKEQEMRHEKHFKYVNDHNVAYWAQSFLSDLQRTCREHNRLRCYGIGFGLGFRTVALDPNFRKLQPDLIARAYQRAQNRLLLLDYDGTMMPQTSINKTPNADVLQVVHRLCSDPRNVVFIVSGRTRAVLAEWFAPCSKMGLAAEHGYFFRLDSEHPWRTVAAQSSKQGAGGAGSAMAWKEAALPVLEVYTESTDGSYVEEKESALVWHHRDADPDFGAWQAKELLDHLESVLANEPVVVRSGHQQVEVKPQGVSKGVVLDQLMELIVSSGKAPGTPDFVLCVGDDRSDEDMFEKLESMQGGGRGGETAPRIAEVFACTVGQKPSKAKYYLDDTSEVLKLLRTLADTSAASAGLSRPGQGPATEPLLGMASDGTGGDAMPPGPPAPPVDLTAGLLPSSLAMVLPPAAMHAAGAPGPALGPAMGPATGPASGPRSSGGLSSSLSQEASSGLAGLSLSGEKPPDTKSS